MRKFEQELSLLVAEHGAEDLSPLRFRRLIGGMQSMLQGVGRDALTKMLESLDVPVASVEVDGIKLRFRGTAEREWLSPFGKIRIRRRTYRSDGPDACASTPLDERCGMLGRYMTPDVEEMAAIGAAMLTANEVELLLSKVLPQGPSATAVQHAVEKLGTAIESKREAIETAIEQEKPLSVDGDVLVASWDGVMMSMREPDGTAWREAGVATVSVYRSGKAGPEKIDTRYLARMPESGMCSLVEAVATQVATAHSHTTRRATVVICDGKNTIWDAATKHPSLRQAIQILDFYHASENLMKAATAIFGDTKEASRWHSRHRAAMQLDKNGAHNARRSMLRYAKALPQGSEERDIVENAAKYFGKHRDRMRYADFIARGLPIGSGPVESAAKNIVQARLRRSGMRWSRDGGQHVLDLRAYLKSDRWEAMWNTLHQAA
ncbi:MAG: ISKra4 family transposase [Nitrospira sp.]